MKQFSKLSLVVLALSVFAVGQFAHAEHFTRVQALKVAGELMKAAKVTNTYGGRYSTVTFNMRTQSISIFRTGDKFEIYLDVHGPGIDVANILVDGTPLAARLN